MHIAYFLFRNCLLILMEFNFFFSFMPSMYFIILLHGLLNCLLVYSLVCLFHCCASWSSKLFVSLFTGLSVSITFNVYFFFACLYRHTKPAFALVPVRRALSFYIHSQSYSQIWKFLHTNNSATLSQIEISIFKKQGPCNSSWNLRNLLYEVLVLG